MHEIISRFITHSPTIAPDIVLSPTSLWSCIASLADRQSQNLNVYTDTPAVLLNPIKQIRRTLARPETESYFVLVSMLKTMHSVVLLAVLFVAGQVWAGEFTDPTRPYQHQDIETFEIEQIYIPNKKVQWRLSGIRLRGDLRTAILNGKLIKEGDDIGAAKVMEIRPREVVLLHEEKHLIVKLLYPDIKRPVNDKLSMEK